METQILGGGIYNMALGERGGEGSRDVTEGRPRNEVSQKQCPGKATVTDCKMHKYKN